MKHFLERKSKGFCFAVSAALCTLLGLIFFIVLTGVSFETSEQPLLIVVLAFVTLLFELIVCFKDYCRVFSVASFILALVTFFCFVAGRVSYLAFYFTGDVLDTGLSAYFVLAFVFLLLAAVASVLAIVFKQEKSDRAAFEKKDLIVMTCLVLAVAVACTFTGLAVGGAFEREHTQHVDADGDNVCDICGQTMSGEEGGLKKPTTSEEVWMAYSAGQYVAEDVSAKAIAYQFAADGLELSPGRNYGVLITLYEDGFVVLSQAHIESSSVLRYYGYWINNDDESLWFCVMYHAYDASDIKTIDYSYTLETDAEGDSFVPFDINLALGFADGGQFVRQASIGGDGAQMYASERDYLIHLGIDPDNLTIPGGSEEEPETPEQGEVLFSFVSDSENFLLDINADGTYTFTFVTAGLVETGSWSWQSWTFTLTDANGKQTVARPDEETHALSLHFVAVANEQVNRDFTCDASVWGAAFGGQGDYTPPAQEEPAEVLFSFVSDSENFLLDINADGTYTFTFVTAGLVETGSWSWQSWTFTLTDANGKQTVARPDGETHALSLHFVAVANEQVNRDFTCDASVWGAAFGGQGDYTAA